LFVFLSDCLLCRECSDKLRSVLFKMFFIILFYYVPFPWNGDGQHASISLRVEVIFPTNLLLVNTVHELCAKN
jgi:hypothetical protein